MDSEGFLAGTWEPGNRLGYASSIATAVLLAAFFWWIGVVDTGTDVAALPRALIAGGVLLGLVLAGGTLAVHGKPAWRERWRISIRLRAAVSVPITVGVAVLLVSVPAVLSVAFVVMAAVFVVGRTYLYVGARGAAD